MKKSLILFAMVALTAGCKVSSAETNKTEQASKKEKPYQACTCVGTSDGDCRGTRFTKCWKITGAEYMQRISTHRMHCVYDEKTVCINPLEGTGGF